MTASIDPVLGLVLRGGLALLFLSAAAHKIRRRESFRTALANYDLLPRAAVGAATFILIGVEIAVGAGLLLSDRVAPAAALLLAVYSGAIAVNLGRGRRGIDCGCGGPAGRVALGGGLLLRNGVLFAAACAAALPSSGRELMWIDVLTAIAGVIAAALLYACCETAMANAAWGRTTSAATWSRA